MALLKSYRRLTDGFRPAPFAPRPSDTDLVLRVHETAESYQSDTDVALAEKANIVREAMQTGKHPLQWLDFVVPAFALATEAVRRTTGMTYYEVQLLAGIALTTGAVAEVQTGEGKTITAAIPAVFHALAGKSVHVATVNAYLAERDYELVAPALELLGITTGVLIEKASPAEKQKVYQKQVVYGTGYEFGFDYLRDQASARRVGRAFLGERFRQQLRGMASADSKMSQHAHDVAIIDEIDSVLIDEANTPLVLSGAAQGAARHASVFAHAARTAKSLQEKTHYVVDWRARSIQLTQLGQSAIFDQFELVPTEGVVRPWGSYVEQALRAAHVLKRDVDYVVQEDQVKLVDQYTGRIFSDRSWRDGLHQAVQYKEGVEITEENTSIARVSRQRYFGLYETLCGMTGTGSGHESEFRGFYGLPIVVVPPRLPTQRVQFPSRYFANAEAKFVAIAQDVHERFASGQPILIGTKTIDESETLEKHFRQLNIPCELLNGKQDRDEADIISVAGRARAVTIATNMAGRGTDIKLDEAAKMAGGLHVIQTQRQDSSRVDRQLIGRCGRQGQPGSHQCFVSAEDYLVDSFGGSLAQRMVQRCVTEDGVESVFDADVDQAQASAEQRSYQQRLDLFRQDQWLDDVLAKVASRDKQYAS